MTTPGPPALRGILTLLTTTPGRSCECWRGVESPLTWSTPGARLTDSWGRALKRRPTGATKLHRRWAIDSSEEGVAKLLEVLDQRPYEGGAASTGGPEWRSYGSDIAHPGSRAPVTDGRRLEVLS